MNINEKLQELAFNLVNNQVLNDFSTNELGKLFVVSIGMNRTRTETDEKPYVNIFSIEDSEEGREDKTFLYIGIDVNEDNKKLLDKDKNPSENNYRVIEYVGFSKAELFKEEIKKQIRKMKVFPKFRFVQGSSIPNEIFPNFATTIVIEISEIISSKGR